MKTNPNCITFELEAWSISIALEMQAIKSNLHLTRYKIGEYLKWTEEKYIRIENTFRRSLLCVDYFNFELLAIYF